MGAAMTDDELKAVMEDDKPVPFGVVRVLAKTTIEAVADLRKRIAALEAATADVQTRGIQFRGVFQRALSYRTGDVTTFKGSMWCAVRPTEATPGESSDWQLCARGVRHD